MKSNIMNTQEKNNIQPAMCSSDVIECLENLIESPYNNKRGSYFVDTGYLLDTINTIVGSISESLEYGIEDIEKGREIFIPTLKCMWEEALQISVIARLVKERMIGVHSINIENLIFHYEESKEK